MMLLLLSESPLAFQQGSSSLQELNGTQGYLDSIHNTRLKCFNQDSNLVGNHGNLTEKINKVTRCNKIMEITLFWAPC